MHFTPKTNPLRRADLDEFVTCYHPANRRARKPTWDAEKHPDGRWRAFDYAELAKRDKANLDNFWLKDKSLEESEDLPEPDVLAREIADDLQTAFEQFSTIAGKLKGSPHDSPRVRRARAILARRYSLLHAAWRGWRFGGGSSVSPPNGDAPSASVSGQHQDEAVRSPRRRILKVYHVRDGAKHNGPPRSSGSAGVASKPFVP
jgi:type I restriction enzyme M protein